MNPATDAIAYLDLAAARIGLVDDYVEKTLNSKGGWPELFKSHIDPALEAGCRTVIIDHPFGFQGPERHAGEYLRAEAVGPEWLLRNLIRTLRETIDGVYNQVFLHFGGSHQDEPLNKLLRSGDWWDRWYDALQPVLQSGCGYSCDALGMAPGSLHAAALRALSQSGVPVMVGDHWPTNVDTDLGISGLPAWGFIDKLDASGASRTTVLSGGAVRCAHPGPDVDAASMTEFLADHVHRCRARGWVPVLPVQWLGADTRGGVTVDVTVEVLATLGNERAKARLEAGGGPAMSDGEPPSGVTAPVVPEDVAAKAGTPHTLAGG